MRRISFRGVFWAALAVTAVCAARAVAPDYKLGDVAGEDVVTPVPLQVNDTSATEALRQKVAGQVPFVVLINPQAADQAEQDLRASVAKAHADFLTTLRAAAGGRGPVPAVAGSPAYSRAVMDVARRCPPDFPLERFAAIWVRGQSDAAMVASLVEPLAEVMAQPIVAANHSDAALPGNRTARLIPVKAQGDAPSAAALETAGATISTGKIITLWRASRLVEAYFPDDQSDLGKYAASLVQFNAMPSSALTEILRSERLEGVTVNDSYAAGEPVVRRGQMIDAKALAALAALREKTLIGTLQAKLDQEQSFSGQIKARAKQIAVGLGIICAFLLLLLWRARSRPSAALVTADADWRTRALVAEGKADRAHEAIRSGVIEWMRRKVVLTLTHQRSELLSAQQTAAAEMREFEGRLEGVHAPLQERIAAYEKRIAELEGELAARGEENRELVNARLAAARQHLSAEQHRIERN